MIRTVRDPGLHDRFGARIASGRLLAGAFVAALSLHLLATIPASKWVGPKTVADLEVDREIRLRIPDSCCPGINVIVSGERERQARWLEAHREATARSLRESSAPSPRAAPVPAAALPAPIDIHPSVGDGDVGPDAGASIPAGDDGDGDGAGAATGDGAGVGDGAGTGVGAGTGPVAPFRIDPEPTFVVPAMLDGGARPKRTTTVSVRAWIDSAGVVTRVELAPGPDENRPDQALVSAALQAASRWRFLPALEGGRAVATTVLLPFRFDRK